MQPSGGCTPLQLHRVPKRIYSCLFIWFPKRGNAHFNNESARFPVTVCTPTCATATQDNQLKTRVYDFLIGPEFKARNHTRFTPFVYALAGVTHTRATFTTAGPTINFHLEKGITALRWPWAVVSISGPRRE
jgi:hypothetical protein